MPETVEIGDTEVEIRETEDGFEVVEKEDAFIEYLESTDSPLGGRNWFEANDEWGDATAEHSFFSRAECMSLDDSDDVRLVHADTENGSVVLHLEDTR